MTSTMLLPADIMVSTAPRSAYSPPRSDGPEQQPFWPFQRLLKDTRTRLAPCGPQYIFKMPRKGQWHDMANLALIGCIHLESSQIHCGQSWQTACMWKHPRFPKDWDATRPERLVPAILKANGSWSKIGSCLRPNLNLGLWVFAARFGSSSSNRIFAAGSAICAKLIGHHLAGGGAQEPRLEDILKTWNIYIYNIVWCSNTVSLCHYVQNTLSIFEHQPKHGGFQDIPGASAARDRRPLGPQSFRQRGDFSSPKGHPFSVTDLALDASYMGSMGLRMGYPWAWAPQTSNGLLTIIFLLGHYHFGVCAMPQSDELGLWPFLWHLHNAPWCKREGRNIHIPEQWQTVDCRVFQMSQNHPKSQNPRP